jgi:hypothetical protein
MKCEIPSMVVQLADFLATGWNAATREEQLWLRRSSLEMASRMDVNAEAGLGEEK